MKFKTLLIINSVIAFLSGIACVLIPAQLLSNYGIALSPMGLIIYQFWGAALIGLGMLTWFTRNNKEIAMQKPFSISLFITNGISCFLALRGQFAGANDFGWSTVVIFFLLTLGFASFVVLRSLHGK